MEQKETELPKGKLLLKLFLTNLYISAVTFGGGFVIVTFMKRKYVEEYGWLEEQEMLDLTALAQSAPGAIAVNASILVGWRMAGLAGMLTAVLATVLPPIAILSVISLFYAAFASNPYVALVLSGMQAGVAAVIADVVCSLGSNVLKKHSRVHTAVMLLVFVGAFFLKINVVLLILAAAAFGLILELWQRRKGASA